MGWGKGSPAVSPKASTISSKCSSSMSSFLAEAYICHCQVIINNPLAFKQIYQTKTNFKGPSVWPIFDSSFRWNPGKCCPTNNLQLVNIEALKKRCSELRNKFLNENQLGTCKDQKSIDTCPPVEEITKQDALQRVCINYDDVPKKKRKLSYPNKKDKVKGGKKQEKERKSISIQEGNCSLFKLSEDEGKLIHTKTFKIFTFQTEPFRLDITCFRPREVEERLHYPNGDLAAKFGIDGTGAVYYKNGDLALHITEGRIGKRLTVMSKSGIDDEGVYRGTVPIGLFDTKGNGVVYGVKGNIRLNYDQAEGIVYDTPSGAPIRWQWKLYHFVMARRQQLEVIQEDELDEEFDPNDILNPRHPHNPERKHSSKKKKLKIAAIKIEKKNKLSPKQIKEEPSKINKTLPSLQSKSLEQCFQKGLTSPSQHREVKCAESRGSKSLQTTIKECNERSESVNLHKVLKKQLHKTVPVNLQKPTSEKKSPALGKKLILSEKAKAGKYECDNATVESMLKQTASDSAVSPAAIEPRPIAMKLNDNISLRILHQEHIHLDFRSFPIHLHLNIGVTLSPGMILRIDKVKTTTENVPDVPCYFEHLFKRSLSLKDIHKSLEESRDKSKKENKVKEIKRAKLMGTYKLKNEQQKK